MTFGVDGVVYNFVNDSKIVGTSVIDGPQHSTDLIGNKVDEKGRVAAFTNVAVTAMGEGAAIAEFNATQRLRNTLIEELEGSKIKSNVKEILEIAKNKNGKIVFLEQGNSNAGFKHILERHEGDFLNAGIKREDIQKVVMDAVTDGVQVGTTGK